MKTILPLSLSLYLFCASALAQQTSNSINAGVSDAEEWDGDHPEKAAEQEFNLTKDPALNYVPRERLLNVMNVINEQRANNSGQNRQALSTASWVERGPNNVGGRTRALMFDPGDVTHKKVWAGGVDGGLWYTNDITVASPVWNVVDNFWANIAVTCIASDPGNSLVFYVGTGEGWFNADAVRGLGIWKTTDGGASWSQLAFTNNNNNFDFIGKIVVTTGAVVAATSSRFCNRGGIFRSTDGGVNWTLVLGTQTGSCATSNCSGADLEIGVDGTMYASLGIFNTGGIHKSTDAGATWISIGGNGFPASGYARIEIATAPSNANRLYAMVQNISTNALLNIYTSANKGATWTTCALPSWLDQNCGSPSTDMTRTQSWYDLIIGVDPTNENTLLVGGVDVFRSTNTGASWTQITNWASACGFQFIHADQHAIVYQPGSSTTALFGNDGGVYSSSNLTAVTPTFSDKNSGYNVTQFYSCAMNPAAGSNNFLAGAQDNGTQKFTTAGINSTTKPHGGDGGFCFIDQTNSSYQIAATVYNNFYRTPDNWSTQTQILSSVTNGTVGSFINPADYDDANHILYTSFSTTQLSRVSGVTNAVPNAAVQFTVTGMSSLATHIRASPYAPAGTTTLFVGTGNGQLYKVTNAGGAPVTTTKTGTGAPWATSASISCVEIGATENDLLVTFSNYGAISVWRSTDGGTIWSNKEGNLPDMPVRWAVYNPNNRNEVFLATEVGVWSTTDITVASPSWVANNNGLANVRVDMFQLRSSDGELIAATHGRGLFSSSVFNSGIPVADFSASQTSVSIGNQVTFTDLSSFSPTSWSWSFPGGTPATSTSQNPVVTYNTAGTYNVSLTATNGSGSNTLTKTNYIFVQSCPLPAAAIASANGTSGNARAPIGTFNFERSHYIITAAEIVAAGLVSANSISGITWTYSTAASVPVAGSLAVYLQNTSDVTDLKSTDWATSISTMTNSRPSSAFTLPGTPTLSFTAPLTTPFVYTGGGVYVAFEWSSGSLSTSTVVSCNTSINPGIYGAQSNASLPTTLAASSFRPLTSFVHNACSANDARVDLIYTLGSLPINYTTNHVIQALVTNAGLNTLTNIPVTLAVSGANTFNNTQNIASLAPGASVTVSFAPFTPSAIGVNNIQVSVPADDINTNNSKSMTQNITTAIYSYVYPGTTSSGGFGFNASAGVLAAKFSTATTLLLSQVNIDITAVAGQQYKIAIYNDNAGQPGTVLYLDAAARSSVVGPDNAVLPVNVTIPAGNFYVGVQQISTAVNMALSFNTENPIRSGSFFLATALPAVTWFNFAPGNNFRPNIELVSPTVTINAFSPATSIRCKGAGSVTYTTTATNSTGITYSLDATTAAFVGNSIISSTGAVTYAAGWSGTTTITASAAGTGGPVTTTHVVTTTPTVTINAFSPATSTRCLGAGSVTYTTTASNSTGITYSLDVITAAFVGNSINTSSGAVAYAAGWTGATTITASAAGCNGPATTTHVVTTTPAVTINPFSPNSSTRCQGTGSVTYATTASNSTGITYSLDVTTAAFIGNSINSSTGEVTYAGGWTGTTTITASAAGCNGPVTTTHVVTINPCGITVNVKALIQGYYMGGGQMVPVMQNQLVPGATSTQTDTVAVELHYTTGDFSVDNNYNIADQYKAVIDVNGNVSGSMTVAFIGSYYYLAISGRNMVRTYSADSLQLTPVLTYDFRLDPNTAYGSNELNLFDGFYAAYSGDVNADESVTSEDVGSIDNDNLAFAGSDYITNDITGDGSVTSEDVGMADNNNLLFIASQHP